MALRRYGGNVAEVVTQVNGDGVLEPAINVELNPRLFDAVAAGDPVQPLNIGGSPITIETDDAGGIPAFYVDDEVVPDPPWFERGGALVRQQLQQAGSVSQPAADDRYILLEDLGQPSGPAELDGSGVLTVAQVPTAAVPTAGLVPRYNADGNVATNDPIADRDAANRRWTLEQVVALAGIQDAEVLSADFTNVTAVNATVGELTVPVLAGDVYFVSACLLYKAAATTDIKVRIDVPTGSIVVGYGEGYDVAASSGTPTLSRQRYANGITGVSNQLNAPFGGIGTGTVHNPIYLEGRVVAGDDGDLRIQASQNTGPDGANPVTIFAGSYCLFAKVAPPA